MCDDQFGGMKHESFALFDDVCRGIEVIPQNRVAEYTCVNAQLMCTAGSRLEAKHRPRRSVCAVVYAPAGLSLFSLDMIDKVSGGVLHVLAQRCIDDSIFTEYGPTDDGEIGLLGFPIVKLA